jgi:hypothetical protein
MRQITNTIWGSGTAHVRSANHVNRRMQLRIPTFVFYVVQRKSEAEGGPETKMHTARNVTKGASINAGYIVMRCGY